MNNKRNLIVGLIVIVALGAGVLTLTKDKPQNNQSTAAVNSSQPATPEAEKSDTQKFLEQYTGEEFDRIYLSNMVAHHSGAIKMANMAVQNAKHEELKTMGREIVSAQTKEIDQMKSWQQAWGYPVSSSGEMVDHSAMGTTGEMDSMTKELEGKSGDEFDKTFIKLMIQHHQSAVAMSKPAERNAGRQEVKDLAKEIINAQTGEIDKLRQWNSQWGYEG